MFAQPLKAAMAANMMEEASNLMQDISETWSNG